MKQFPLNTMLGRVREMHTKFGLDDVQFGSEEYAFRIASMQEELNEFIDASEMTEEFDAMIDLAVFVFGTVDRMGLLHVFEEGFNRVMDANMNKEVGQTPDTKARSFKLDLIKPADWKAPNHVDLVARRKPHGETNESN